MGRPISISISGRGRETDAPSVQELLDQIGDCLAILREVEQALSADGTNEIEWRVTGASKNSPLMLELAPFPRQHGMNIDRRTQEVKQSTACGLALLASGAERPRYFTEQTLEFRGHGSSGDIIRNSRPHPRPHGPACAAGPGMATDVVDDSLILCRPKLARLLTPESCGARSGHGCRSGA